MIYEYLRNSVESTSPQEMIGEFRYLFLELVHSNREIRKTLENIILAKHKEDIFFQILNYCCHILINYWSKDVNHYPYIIDLIEIFNQTDFHTKKPKNRTRQKLYILIEKFKKTQKFNNLKRIATFINAPPQITLEINSLISDLLPHYFYLYSSVLLGKERTPGTTSLILKLQKKSQKSFESQLAQHIIYRSRLIQIARAKQLSNRAGKIIKRVKNPTFLGEKELKKALKQYLRKIDLRGTLHQCAKQFLIEITFLNSYKDFKHSLSKYLIVGIKTSNKSQYSLQEKLNLVIYDNISAQYDFQPCTDQLILQTCQRLLRYFIIDSTRQDNHYQLIELVMNLGITQTTALFMKIVLIAPAAKSDLEHRLGIIFSFYEHRTVEEAKWLIQLLENILIAFSFYFGNIDMSIPVIRRNNLKLY